MTDRISKAALNRIKELKNDPKTPVEFGREELQELSGIAMGSFAGAFSHYVKEGFIRIAHEGKPNEKKIYTFADVSTTA